MTPQECAAALTYANQIDPRIQLNDSSLEVWESALSNADPEQVRWVIKDHYSSGVNANESHQTSITPALIRRRVSDEVNRAEARRSALEAESRLAIAEGAKRERVKQSQTSEYQRAMIQGAIDHLTDLERRGIIRPDQQARLDHFRETGEYKAPNDGRGMR